MPSGSSRLGRLRTEAISGSAGGLAYREAGPPDGAPVLLVHGYPESSYMWVAVMSALADAGCRAVAPDLAGFGDSPPDPPGTWERHAERLEELRSELGLERSVLVVHDWGGLIGLRWACDHPGAARALVISGSGFFPDGKWHGMAKLMRTPGTGEEAMAAVTREGLGAILAQSSGGIDDRAIDEYWKAFADDERRRAHLELYRSGDFEKLAPYEGRLAALDLPVLLLWGERDEFAPVASARRFQRELPHTELVIVDGAGHFVFEDAPDRAAAAVTEFVEGLG
ncbi:MAG TPA: alpha/beta fold hydrolase [Thermoleophilaceae bacterium]|nr:alpha/beta fold hydrolase [Thermoleophilaceae bacterium]